MLVFLSFVFTHKKSIALIYEAMDFCFNKNSHLDTAYFIRQHLCLPVFRMMELPSSKKPCCREWQLLPCPTCRW